MTLSIGIQLNLDFIIEADMSSAAFQERLIGMSGFASALRIAGIHHLYREPIDVPVISSILGGNAQAVAFVRGELGVAAGRDQILIDGHITVAGWLEQKLGNVPPQIAAIILRNRDEIVRRMVGPCMDLLSLVARRVAVGLILDEQATQLYGMDCVRRFRMLTLGSAPGNDVVMPFHLSPELVSERPSDASLEEICVMVTERAASPALLSTVYLHDLLVAAAEFPRSRPEPLQLLEHHCRFRIPATLALLDDDEPTNMQIRDFVGRKPSR
jgi:hypothetical protein